MARDERRGGRDEEAPHGCATGDDRGGTVESGITIPKPTPYGGRRIGRWPGIGEYPSRARAAARSQARAPLQASKDVFTVGAWLNRYGLPKLNLTVGLTEYGAVVRRANAFGWE